MRARASVLGVIVLVCFCTTTRAVVLYDGPAGTAPAAQGWLSHYSIPGTGVQTVGGGKTIYDTNALIDERGGYSSHTLIGTLVNPSFPVLDRTVGYVVSMDLRVINETHVSNDRAGFSIIALSSDLMGIELGFWSNEVWAQSGPTFTHAEGVAYDTTSAFKTYDLTIAGSNYSLSANGSTILSGALRNYSSFGFPYTTTNWLFVGDDTTSARGAFEFSRLAVVVPEPTALGVSMILAIGFLRRR
jgi:hypothetical protein